MDSTYTQPLVEMGVSLTELAVKGTAFKMQGYGKLLLDYSLKKATELGFGAVCFEGDINFYGKSGFTFAKDFGIRYHGLPADADSSFFLCKELNSGYLADVSGEYVTPQGYFVNENEAEEFDRLFSL